MIPVYKPWITDLEKKTVNEIMESGWISSKGPYISKFEEAFASYLGEGRHCVAVCNGTAACHLALKGAGVTKKSVVLVPDLTFVATYNTTEYCRATSIITEVEPTTWNINLLNVCDKQLCEATHLFLVHLYGNPCNMDEVRQVCKDYDIIIVEDACEAIGTKYNGQRAGTFGDTAAFSFFGNKTITTGEGGMVVCKNKEVADRVRLLAGQYQTKEYFHPGVGYNYRMTNIQAGLGYCQISRIDEIQAEKKRVWDTYLKCLSYHHTIQRTPVLGEHGKWMVAVKAESALGSRSRLLEAGVETRGSFYPLSATCFHKPHMRSLELSQQIVLLPSYPELTDAEIKQICDIF